MLAKALNNTIENIDIFTVMHSPVPTNSAQVLDVRFSSHGSPYYSPERINAAIVNHREEVFIFIDLIRLEQFSPKGKNIKL